MRRNGTRAKFLSPPFIKLSFKRLLSFKNLIRDPKELHINIFVVRMNPTTTRTPLREIAFARNCIKLLSPFYRSFLWRRYVVERGSMISRQPPRPRAHPILARNTGQCRVRARAASAGRRFVFPTLSATKTTARPLLFAPSPSPPTPFVVFVAFARLSALGEKRN